MNSEDKDIDKSNVKKAAQALDLLINMNDKKVTAPLVGWIVACHLKPHIVAEFGKFPLLNVWGRAGSGKTRTINMFTELTQVSPECGNSSIDLRITAINSISRHTTSTTEIPKVLEGFDRGGLSDKVYRHTGKILTVAYDSREILKETLMEAPSGTLRSSKTVRVTTPLIYTSNQLVDSPFLRQRTVSVGMVSVGAPPERSGIREEVFKQLQELQQDLRHLGELLMLQALTTTQKDVVALYGCNPISTPPEISLQQQFNLQTVLAGLDFLLKTCQHNGMEEPTLENIRKLKSDFTTS